MEKEKQAAPRPVALPAKIARILLKVILILFLFIVLVFLLVLTPPVQRFLTNKVENFLENKIKTPVEIGSISFGLSGNINLEDIYLEDQTRDTLLAGENIRAHLNFIRLFQNEVEIRDIELQGITAKIRRVLPDTVFNFQYIVDAFATAPAQPADTTAAPMKFNISDLTLENVRLLMNDDVTGNNMQVRIGNLAAAIDQFDPYTQTFDLPSLILRNTRAKIVQTKPLVTPEPAAADLAEAAAPIPLNLSIGTIDLSNVDFDYGNDVSAFYTVLDIGKLRVDGRLIDLARNRFWLDEISLANTTANIRLGRKEEARQVVEEAAQEVAAQEQQGFDFRVGRIRLDNNNISFNNDNEPRLSYGMDYAHLRGEALTLHADDFIMNDDSIYTRVTRGALREQSGFVLQELRGDLLYANNQSYLKDLYLKTPGTELKRSAVLEYASYEALASNFGNTLMDIAIEDSRIQVKDILTFAPDLRSQPAFRNPNDVWYIDLVGSGNMNRLYLERLAFDGFGNTQINASGTLAGLNDPNAAGGTFRIQRLHTTQADLALLTGQDLSTPELNLPESINMSGTLNGNMADLQADLDISTSLGFAALNGRFINLTQPERARYNATLRTNNLRLGTLLPGNELGAVTARFQVSGSGMSPEAANVRFNGDIGSFGYNSYTYRNISLNGGLQNNTFTVDLDSRDPNAFLRATASGSLGTPMRLELDAAIDSLRTLPLNLTTTAMAFHGNITGTVSNLSPDYLEADVLVTEALFVSEGNRLPLDSLQLSSGRTDTSQFIRLQSDIANVAVEGQYRFSELGAIIQNNIQPYYSATPTAALAPVQPYDIRFNADVAYSPALAGFVPGLTALEGLQAEGRLATGEGMRANITSPFIAYGANKLSNLQANIYTDDSGLHVQTQVDRLVSGSAFDLYNTQINATALNNNISFGLNIHDRSGADRYLLGGLLTQPEPGTMTISLRPDSLLLNYEPWNIAAGNSISIEEAGIVANNFVLSRSGQQLSLQSRAGANSPLDVRFQDFRLATLTGFVKSDSLLVDGLTNGTVTLENLTTQPAFTGDLGITDLSFRQDTIGNVALQVASAGNRYNTDVRLNGRGNDLQVSGYFEPQAGDMALNLDVAIRQLSMETLEGALSPVITDASGGISGDVAVRGTAGSPDIQGSIDFDTTRISTTVLGGPLTINDETLLVTENGILFDYFTIRDSSGNELEIDGEVLTSNFINYNLDLDIEADNFRALSTKRQTGSLYYGDLVISSDLRIRGTESAPVVTGNVVVGEGTDFSLVIPQEAPGVVQREGVVEFIDFSNPTVDSLFLDQTDTLNNTGLAGFDLSVTIDMREEANLNVVVDPANGDFLNIRGSGQLAAGIDPSGNIALTGRYEIAEGAYRFSFNFLQREFQIQKGSQITWLGEPTNAQVDVTAIYIANTAPVDLVGDQVAADQRAYYMQELPFEVLLSLEGELMKPQITFDVVLPEDQNYLVNTNVEEAVRTRLTQIRQEPSELNKQVFALLLLNRFVGENPFQSSGEGGFNAGSLARQSVSKLLTEQLNNLAGGLIAGVDLNFDVTSADDYTTGQRQNRTDLNVGLSKQLLNDRLTVTVGSNFQLEGPQQVNQSNNNIAGNVSVNYQLSRDGRYLLRFYRKNDYEGNVYGYVIETGLGFVMSVDYNNLRQLFNRRQRREERQRRREAEQQQQNGEAIENQQRERNGQKNNNQNQEN